MPRRFPLSDFEAWRVAIEARLTELEKISHPPADLNAPVLEAMAVILERAARDVRRMQP
jgi:hypothetical protein